MEYFIDFNEETSLSWEYLSTFSNDFIDFNDFISSRSDSFLLVFAIWFNLIIIQNKKRKYILKWINWFYILKIKN